MAASWWTIVCPAPPRGGLVAGEAHDIGGVIGGQTFEHGRASHGALETAMRLTPHAGATFFAVIHVAPMAKPSALIHQTGEIFNQAKRGARRLKKISARANSTASDQADKNRHRFQKCPDGRL